VAGDIRISFTANSEFIRPLIIIGELLQGTRNEERVARKRQ
jgi:hypothetical protein